MTLGQGWSIINIPNATTFAVNFANGGSTITSGGAFTQNSGSSIISSYNFSNTVNQTGGTGVVAGVYINPTITSVSNILAGVYSNLPSTPPLGGGQIYAQYHVGTAPSYFGGNILMGSTSGNIQSSNYYVRDWFSGNGVNRTALDVSALNTLRIGNGFSNILINAVTTLNNTVNLSNASASLTTLGPTILTNGAIRTASGGVAYIPTSYETINRVLQFGSAGLIAANYLKALESTALNTLNIGGGFATLSTPTTLLNFTGGNNIITNTTGQLTLSSSPNFNLLLSTTGNANASGGVVFTKPTTITATANNHMIATISGTFAQSGLGVGVQAGLAITHTIAQTAAGKQPVRAIYIKPTLTTLLGNNIAMEAVTGQIIVGDSRPSLNTTSGAVIIEGGLGVKGNIYGSAGALKQLNILAFGSSGAVTANYAKVARATAAGTLNLGEDFPTINIAGKHQFTNKGLTVVGLDANTGNGLVIQRTSSSNAATLQFNTNASIDFGFGMTNVGFGTMVGNIVGNTVINVTSTRNIALFTGQGIGTPGAGSFGGGVGVLNITNALTIPSSNITTGTLVSSEKDSFILRNPAGKLATFSSTAGLLLPYDISLTTVGKGVKIKEGSNARMGIATLSGGTVTVANTTITANTRIMLTVQSLVGTAGLIYVSARVASTSFTITSSAGGSDGGSTVAWVLIEPA